MSNGNTAFSRAENLMGMFVQHNGLRAHQRLHLQRCRRQMRIEPEARPAGVVAMYQANSSAGSLSVPGGKCQTRGNFLEAETVGSRHDLEVEITVRDMRIHGSYPPDHFVISHCHRRH